MMLGLMLLVNAIILKNSFMDESPDYRAMMISLPLLVIAAINSFGNRNSG